MNSKAISNLAAVILLAALPFIGFYPIFVMQVLCYAIFACSFNLLLGYTGLLSFGHAAFLGTGAYLFGHVTVVWGWPTIVSLPLAAVFAGVLGLVFGYVSIKRSGIYFAMITLALSQMLFFFYLQSDFTHGEDGIQGIPRGSIFGIDLYNEINLYFFVLVIFLAVFWFIWRVVNSPFGSVLFGIRDNEERMTSLGYDVDRFKLMVFVISALIAGMAGATKALVLSSATLSDADWHMSGLVVLMTLVGGVGTLLGPVIGAIVVVSLENQIGDLGYFLENLTGIEKFQILGESVTPIIGFVFVICVMFFRRGIVGEVLAYSEQKKLKT